MAEDTTPFSSLDPLGPEYGRADLPTIDSQGISPFEGDKIEDPKINFPKEPEIQYNAVSTAGRGLINTHYVTKRLTGQPPGRSGVQPGLSASQVADAFGARIKGNYNAAQDKGTYGGRFNYNAGPSGNAYYKKYHALGQEKFDQIGFSPLQDNESVFGSQTSRMEEFSRTMSHSFAPLFANAFVSGPKSLVNALQGDFSADTESAKLYEEAAAIGQSSKGGLFGFFNNTLISSAYTAGIISEAILEEVALSALTVGTGGAAGGALAVATANNARKIPGIFRTLKGMDKAVDGMKAMKTSLNTLNDINNTRSYFNKIKSAVSPVGKFLNPAENLTDAVSAILRNEDNLTGLARTANAINKTAGGLYRDVRGINMALSEARLEGGFTQNDTYDQLYSAFYEKNQRRPEDNEQKLLYQKAKEAGATAIGWNVGIIHASNKIMFPNILGPKGGINNFIKAKTKDILDLKAGKIIFENAGKKAAKEGVKAGAQKGMQGTFKYVENSLMNSIKGLAKDPVRAIPKVLGYAKANFSEGIQENLQEVIAETTKNYYVNTYKDPAMANFNYAKSLFNTSLTGQFSAKGFETFASGFAMGLFGAPMNHIVPMLSYGKARLFNNEKYQQYVQAKQQVGTQMVNNLNALGADPTEFFNSKMTNLSVQNAAGHVIKNGSTKEKNDAKSEAFISQLTTAFETNTLDFFKEHIKSFKQYTPEEFEEALGFEKGTGAEYQGRIDDIVAHADTMHSTYKDLNEKFPDKINLEEYKKGSDDYNRAAIYKSALAESKRSAVFFKHSYDDTKSRMVDIGQKILSEKPLKNMSTSEMQSLFEPSRMKAEADMLKYEVETLRQSGKAEDKIKADKIEAKITTMQNFLSALNYRAKHYALDSTKVKSDFIDSLTEEQKEQITEEDLDKLLDEELANQNMVRRSKESDTKMDNHLGEAYSDYLKAVADITDDTYFQADADKAFYNLLDFYNLDNESRAMAKYVNLLNNPGDFADVVERNFEWMKQLWENRKDYYKEQVQASMNAFADNALLNELADENFYVSLDEFAVWQETGEVPSEFFNDQRNIVIREGNPEYDRFVGIFDRAFIAREAGVLDENYNYDEELKKELEDLATQQAAEIDALPKIEVTTELEAVEPSKGGKVTYKDIDAQVKISEYIDITFKTKTGKDTMSLFRSEDGTFTDVNSGTAIDLKALKLDITDNRRYSIDLKADPELEKEIIATYKNKQADVINKYADKKTKQAEDAEQEQATPAAAKPAKEAVTYTSTDEFDEMDKALQDKLQEAFEGYLNTNATIDASNWDDDEYMLNLRSFVRTNGVARRVIDDYNKKSKLTAATESAGAPDKLIIKIADKEIDLTNESDEVINKNKRLLMLYINNLNTKDNRTPDENLKLAEAKADKAKIDRFQKGKTTETVSAKMQESINRLNLVFEAQKRLEKRDEAYYVNNKRMNRVTKAIETLKITEYSYSDEAKVLASVNQTLVKGGTIEEFIASLRSKKPSGFSEYTYNELAKELKQSFSEGPSKNIKSKEAGISLISTPVSKIVEELSKFKTLNEKLNWLKDNNLLSPININGKKYNVLDYSDRVMVLMKVGKYNIPFYISTGQAGKKNVKAGNWYAVFGIGVEKGWINKGDEEQINNNYGFQLFEKLSKILNEGIGTIQSREDNGNGKLKDGIGFLSDSKEDLEAFNNNMNLPTSPAGKNSDVEQFYNHVNGTLSLLNDELLKLNTPGTVDVKADNIRNEVMAIVKEKTYEASRIAGNYIDNEIKNVFDPAIGKAVFNEDSITKEGFDNLFGPQGIVTDLKARFDRNEIAVFTKDIRVFDTEAGIAGEIDIIIVDRDGNVKIVDVKTGEANKWNNFQAKDKFGYQKQIDYILQQTAYANLLFNMTGLDASIGVLPIQITKDAETGKITSAESPKAISGLLPGKYEIPLDKSLYQKEMDTLIPRKGVAVESKESAEAANLESIPRQDADDAPSPAVKAQDIIEEKPVGVGKGDPDTTKQFAMRIKVAKSKEALNSVKASLNKAVKKLSAAEVMQLSNLIEEKLESLSEGILKLNKENLKENDKLIVKTPIFIRGAKWTVYGNTLVITGVTDQGVTVRKARGKKEESLTFAQVNALTILKDSLTDMNATTEKPLTKKEQEIIAKSKANLDEFAKDFGRLEAIETEADAMTVEDIEERLFNQNICE